MRAPVVDDFYEDDEEREAVMAAFRSGEPGVTSAKPPCWETTSTNDTIWLEQHPLLTFYDRVAEARAGYRPPLIVQVLDAVFVFVNGVFRLVDQIVNLMWRLP